MKIIGFSEINNELKMVLKSDSSLLVNRKPFFIPEWSHDIRMTPCIVVRICKLGKCIARRFAHRYYDCVAFGANLQALDFIEKGDNIRGWAFDYSLPLGVFREIDDHIPSDLVIEIEEAISRISDIMTLRQGDMIFIDRRIPSTPLVPEQILCHEIDGEEVLYCKIKGNLTNEHSEQH
jgi:2-keto-4-pentenoate hydratase/2-oxohepta-3-ene-1,7-dioic acid hydratase in catechol pathway